LWKFNGERLENKNGLWMYWRETWTLLIEDKKNEGQTIENSLGSVLTVDSERGMHLKIKHLFSLNHRKNIGQWHVTNKNRTSGPAS
jgi:hypothetical protein